MYDPVNSRTYSAYVVHGFGSPSEINDPWVVLVSTDDNNGGDGINFGQGSSNFYNMNYTSVLTGAPSGNNLYDSFRYFKGATQVGLVTGTLTPPDNTYWKTFNIVQDVSWSTGNYSFYDALHEADQFLLNSPTDYSNDNSYFQSPSTVGVTAEYSGQAYAGSLQLSRTGDELGNGTQDLNYFIMTGDFYQGDNDLACISFINRKPRDTIDFGGNDDYHGSGQYGSKWTFWNNDFHSNSNNQRIGYQNDFRAGMIDSEFAPNMSRLAFVIAK
jgi:hypothetical protein